MQFFWEVAIDTNSKSFSCICCQLMPEDLLAVWKQNVLSNFSANIMHIEMNINENAYA
jgi:hypothetical protein